MIKAMAICGPTASGKTGLSIMLSKKIPLEIISLDSMQIYKGMDIGTAKATKEEQSIVKHHMIDVVSPSEPYSVGKYRAGAIETAREIASRKRLPLFVGGTGLYYDSLTRAFMDEAPESDSEFRTSLLLNTDTEEKKRALWEELSRLDPESAEKIHFNNVRRVIRALEIYNTTGKKKSELDRISRESASELDLTVVCLDFHNRENLYARVDMRADAMLSDGLLDEVRSLYEGGLLKENSTALCGIGYKEIISHLKGQISLDEAIMQIKLSSRRYAKRQLTWFRHVTDNKHTLFIDNENGNMRNTDSVFLELLEIAKTVYEDSK
jgi:tRNA dimethylallyltransferase